MLLDDAVADRQPQPGPLPDPLGGEERIEDLLQMIGLDAGAVVLDADPDTRGRPAGRDAQHALAVRLGHRLLGVDDDVQDDLLQLVRIGQGLRQVLREIGLHLDVAHAHLVGAQLERGLDDAVDRRHDALGLVLAGEGQEVLHDAGRPLGLVADALQGTRERRLLVLLQEELREPGDAGQRVVQLVRHARHQAADRRHLLVLQQLLAHLLLFGDLARHVDDVETAPGLVEAGDGGQGEDPLPALDLAR